MRVLLVEDDAAVAQSIELMLKSESFNVCTTDHGNEAVDLAKLYDYDLVVLGDTPELTSVDMVKSIRLAKVKTSIIVISNRKDVESVVFALGVGADDYVPLPFYKDELIARIHAVVRRSKGHAQSVITAGPLSLNLDSKLASVNGVPMHLTGKEFQMLELLMLRKGQVQSKESFLNYLYGGMDEPDVKIIDVFICKLRRKLTEAGADGAIETVWGRGYLVRDHVESPSIVPELRELVLGDRAHGDNQFYGNSNRRPGAA